MCPAPVLARLHMVSLRQEILSPTDSPHYGKQMRVHDFARASKEWCYTTNAKKEEIFSDIGAFHCSEQDSKWMTLVHYTYAPPPPLCPTNNLVPN